MYHSLLHNSFLLSYYFWKWNGADLKLKLWAMGELKIKNAELRRTALASKVSYPKFSYPPPPQKKKK